MISGGGHTALVDFRTVRRRHFGSVRKLPSGRWQASYWYEGRHHVAPRTYVSKADAQAWLTNADSQIARGTWAAPAAGRLTVDELAERWLASNPLKRVSSVERDRSILRHILPVLGPCRLAQVSRADLQKMVDRWVLRYSPSTVGRMASVLRALFSYAVDAELVARSPASGLRLPRTRLVERPVLTADDLERLAKALGPDDAPMMWLGVIGGLRWAECAGLAVRDLDLLSSTVSVRQQLGRDGRLGPPKSEAGKRRLAVPTWLVEDLSALLARRGLTAVDADALVFVSSKGSDLRYQNWLRRYWRPACEAAGRPELHFHDLRSMSATVLVTNGVDIKTAQTRLGHASPAVTLAIYARATAEADRRAADALGEAFGFLRARSAARRRRLATRDRC